jgi:hypothetical protein
LIAFAKFDPDDDDGRDNTPSPNRRTQSLKETTRSFIPFSSCALRFKLRIAHELSLIQQGFCRLPTIFEADTISISERSQDGSHTVGSSIPYPNSLTDLVSGNEV